MVDEVALLREVAAVLRRHGLGNAYFSGAPGPSGPRDEGVCPLVGFPASLAAQIAGWETKWEQDFLRLFSDVTRPCPVCKVGAGQPCKSAEGRPVEVLGDVHEERVPKD